MCLSYIAGGFFTTEPPRNPGIRIRDIKQLSHDLKTSLCNGNQNVQLLIVILYLWILYVRDIFQGSWETNRRETQLVSASTCGGVNSTEE